jgi:hypothetical protein
MAKKISWTDQQKRELYEALKALKVNYGSMSIKNMMLIAYKQCLPKHLWRGMKSETGIYAAAKSLQDFARLEREFAPSIPVDDEPPIFMKEDEEALDRLASPEATKGAEPPAPETDYYIRLSAPLIHEMKATVQQTVRDVLTEHLTNLSRDNDDRLQVMLDLMTERMQRFETRMVELTKVTAKKLTVLLVGGRDKDISNLRQRFPSIEFDNVEEGVRDLSTKGNYDLVIHWATFSSHSIENVLKTKYKSYEKVKTGAGLSTIIDLIKQRFPK